MIHRKSCLQNHCIVHCLDRGHSNTPKGQVLLTASNISLQLKSPCTKKIHCLKPFYAFKLRLIYDNTMEFSRQGIDKSGLPLLAWT